MPNHATPHWDQMGRSERVLFLHYVDLFKRMRRIFKGQGCEDIFMASPIAKEAVQRVLNAGKNADKYLSIEGME